MAKLFDLNTDKVLENWDVAHAIREIIANAIDEQIITNTEEIQISKDSSGWHIRDFGRGLQCKHLIQNENPEKKERQNLIGKFGVGLKDALAVFDRHEVKITIKSKYGEITLVKEKKNDFNDLKTLHASIDEKPIDMVGTDIIIFDCSDEDIENAKNLFLQFINMEPLHKNEYGEIYQKQKNIDCVFINGVRVAEKNNFMFSYNITKTNAKIEKALNRERSNVGKDAYTDTIKKILLNCKDEEIIKLLSDGLLSLGDRPYELSWKDIEAHIVEKVNKDQIVMTHDQYERLSNDERDLIKEKEIIYVSNSDVLKKVEVKENVTTISKVKNDYNKSFKYKFIPRKNLNSKEKEILSYAEWAFNFMKAKNLKSELEISDKLRPDIDDDLTCGVWDKDKGKIVIKRCQLQSLDKFLGTLIHEIIHATKNEEDVTREFEHSLTETIGKLAKSLATQ